VKVKVAGNAAVRLRGVGANRRFPVRSAWAGGLILLAVSQYRIDRRT
jgi:hypothetical protein